MNKLSLQIMSMIVLTEMSISKEEKGKILEEIKSLDEFECMSFIMDQKIYNLNDKGREEVMRRFIKEQSIVINHSNVAKLLSKIPVVKAKNISNKMSVGERIKALKKYRKDLLRAKKGILKNNKSSMNIRAISNVNKSITNLSKKTI